MFDEIFRFWHNFEEKYDGTEMGNKSERNKIERDFGINNKIDKIPDHWWGKGSSINDVTKFWTIFVPIPPSSHVVINPWALPPRPWRHLWTTPKSMSSLVVGNEYKNCSVRFVVLLIAILLSDKLTNKGCKGNFKKTQEAIP